MVLPHLYSKYNPTIVFLLPISHSPELELHYFNYKHLESTYLCIGKVLYAAIEKTKGVCVCVCVCVCVLTEKSWSLSTSSLHYDVKEKIFSFKTDLPLFFSKREHWYLVFFVCVCVCVCVYEVRLVAQLCPTLSDPMDHSHQAPLSMGLSQQEYWSVLPFPPPGDCPNSRIEPTFPTSPALQVECLLLSDRENVLLFKFQCLSLVSAKR